MKNRKICLAYIITILGICLNSCKKEDHDISLLIANKWFNEEYQEYDQFYESGVYYYEYPYNSNVYIKGNGTFTFEDKILTLNFKFDGKDYKTTNKVTFKNNKMFWEDQKTGDIYEYLKVVEDVKINMRESVSLSTILPNYTINDFKFINGVAYIDLAQNELVGLMEGNGYVKLFTNEGEVMLKLSVTNENYVCVPDFAFAIGKLPNEIYAVFGTPHMVQNDYIAYEYKNSLVKTVMFATNETSQITEAVGITLNDNIKESEVIKYLENNYKRINNTFCFLGKNENSIIVYNPKTSYITFCNN